MKYHISIKMNENRLSIESENFNGKVYSPGKNSIADTCHEKAMQIAQTAMDHRYTEEQINIKSQGLPISSRYQVRIRR